MSDSKPRYFTLLEQIDAFLAENPPPPAEGPTLQERMAAWLKARSPFPASSDGRECAFCGAPLTGEHHSARYCRECRDPDSRQQILATVKALEETRSQDAR